MTREYRIDSIADVTYFYACPKKVFNIIELTQENIRETLSNLTDAELHDYYPVTEAIDELVTRLFNQADKPRITEENFIKLIDWFRIEDCVNDLNDQEACE